MPENRNHGIHLVALQGSVRPGNNTETTARLLMFFAPSGIEGMFDEAASNEELANHPEQAIDALNTIGEPYGVQFFEE